LHQSIQPGITLVVDQLSTLPKKKLADIGCEMVALPPQPLVLFLGKIRRIFAKQELLQIS
jgi:hypothetical protein